MMVLYVVSFLDRVNVGFAALTMNADLGFSPEIYGWGAGIFFFGYFLFEVPSNLVLQKVGARLWICRIMVTWGLISAATAFVTDATGFFIARFLLGAAEARFLPGMILYLGYWFPLSVRARHVALFMAAVPISSALRAPLSAWILDAHGLLGLAGWQWLFIIEGCRPSRWASPCSPGCPMAPGRPLADGRGKGGDRRAARGRSCHPSRRRPSNLAAGAEGCAGHRPLPRLSRPGGRAVRDRSLAAPDRARHGLFNP